MDITASDCIATAALFVSFASVFYTKKQSDQARVTSHNDYRAHLSEKHDSYRKALKHVTDRHKAEISRLCGMASTSLRQIECLFDQYDNTQRRARPLRHLISECSEMVYYAFKGQLGSQTALNLSHRLAQVIRVEGRSDPNASLLENRAFRSSFEQQYYKDIDAHQETELLSSAYFCDLVHQIGARIDAANGGKLLLEVQDILSPLNAYLIEIQPGIGDSAAQLEELLESSDLEHFSLAESPKIYRRLRYRKATYSILSHLRPHEVDKDFADRYHNFVSVSIYNCAILQAIQGFGSWGWDDGQR